MLIHQKQKLQKTNKTKHNKVEILIEEIVLIKVHKTIEEVLITEEIKDLEITLEEDFRIEPSLTNKDK